MIIGVGGRKGGENFGRCDVTTEMTRSKHKYGEELHSMSYIVALGLPTAFLCGGWCLLAGVIGLGALSWAGFAGCTAYFACPDKSMKGVISCICCLMSGVGYALISIYLGNHVLTFPYAGIILTIIATFLMCVQNKVKVLEYIPGTFLGSFSTFAAGGSLRIIPALLLGVLLGILCDKTGQWIFKKWGKQEADS